MTRSHDFKSKAKNLSSYCSHGLKQLAGAFAQVYSSLLGEEDMNVGRIVASVTIENATDLSKTLRCDALVDTGASLMVLPRAWKDRLGELDSS